VQKLSARFMRLWDKDEVFTWLIIEGLLFKSCSIRKSTFLKWFSRNMHT